MTKEKDLRPDMEGIEIQLERNKTFNRCSIDFIDDVDTNLCPVSNVKIDENLLTLSLDHLGTLLIILPIGLLISTFIFAIEILTAAYITRKNKSQL